MATGKKKYKIFKICKELNLGHETIVLFLEKDMKMKVSGPNASIDEDMYLAIIDRFATEKEKAERLKARKQPETGEGATSAEQETATDDGSRAYLDVLKRSIEEGVEALAKTKDEPLPEPKPKRKTAGKRKVKAEEKPAEKVKAKPEVEPETKPEAAETKETAEPKPEEVKVKVEETIEEKKKKIPKREPVVDPTLKKEKAEKPKVKEKKAAKKEEEPVLSDKEKKRRKALEMIRKEKDAKRLKKTGFVIGEETGEGTRSRRKRKKSKKKQVDQKEVQKTLKKTLASIDSKGRKTKRKKVKTEDGEIIERNVIQVTEFISANDLANLMGVSVAEIITKCLELGLVVSINQRLDIDTIRLLAEEYDYEVEEQYASEFIEEELEEEEEVDESQLVPRAPIVTIMGHVDHGKTSLLDYLRHSHITAGEAGGITQHIGAYEIEFEGKKITFLDTPGHEAFTAMRARGAQVTDIVVLIIAADDAVMPQTDEALDHAKAAGVRIVIAINKVDKPGANPEKIKQQLSERNVLVEDWGGEYQCVEISAKTGQGIPDLLERILLEAELLDLKANPNRRARGVVIESRLDKGKGAVATVLVQDGTLKIGDNFVAGHNYGRVRALFNEMSERIKEVGPAQPALVVGFEGVAQAGDRLIVMPDEKSARELAFKRQQIKREQDAKQVKLLTLDQISEQIRSGEVHELPILVKADVDGSAEALADALFNLNTDEVKVNVIRKAVGPISESDVLLASASGSVIVGFHVRANAKARELAQKENVDIRIYRVIYDAINDIKLALEGMLAPTEEETVVGLAEVREVFKISRLGTIAGCYVTDGKIIRKNPVRLIRDDVEIYTGNIASLKRFKEDVREVATGFECGIQIENFNDLKVGDIIESYEISTVKRRLA